MEIIFLKEKLSILAFVFFFDFMFLFEYFVQNVFFFFFFLLEKSVTLSNTDNFFLSEFVVSSSSIKWSKVIDHRG